MSRKKRATYKDLTVADRKFIIHSIKAGGSKNSIFQLGRYTKQAIDLVIENAGIDYKPQSTPPKGAARKKPEPIRTEDIPKLCAEEMPPLHKMLNKVWKPTGVRA